MAVFNSKYATREYPVPYPDGSAEVIAVRFAYTVPATIALNDIIEIAVLPAYCRVVDMILDADDLDTGGSPAIVLDVGIMSGAVGDGGTRTIGAEFFSGATTAQAGGVVRPTLKTAFRVAPTSDHRSIGVKIATAAATAAAGEIGLTVLYATA
ncbi:hypothetical protein EZH22_24430 [Xanthobacter dioxanivorans]|uniref:Uncharacterized protein n=1 Tax=Xanthobacter dioxanivorans TaxID=2528964 RepID=A0A974PM47_9HYPH|nr:hypothetical protein [Xanthobacter dioxanivorans]QRG06102.1 hypothetical protein EZH22_24430 [Xanthobacter dioxanivorans]